MDVGPLWDFLARNFFLLSDVEEYAERAQMVMIELLGVSAIDRSNVEESSEHHCTENLQEFSRSL